ncbi:LPXTG cell wall anchor domain-containing protein [Streptomyces sp. NBC_00140]|nr:LPXTG cell wall anchor domain-containing protein [Streptomyces sp. NBC_00140]MCX5338285.1 LPXTG cell wall anchor domain-containing protein [Streptomyces sp. NBC_00140]
MLVREVGAAVAAVFVVTNSVAATVVVGVVLISLGWLLRKRRR